MKLSRDFSMASAVSHPNMSNQDRLLVVACRDAAELPAVCLAASFHLITSSASFATALKPSNLPLTTCPCLFSQLWPPAIDKLENY